MGANNLTLTNNFSYLGSFPGYFPFAKFPNAQTLNSANGNNDLYTVPTGRKALVTDIMVTNSTGGAINYYPQIKINGTTYRIGASTSEGAGGIGHNYSMISTRSAPIVLNAGEVFSVNAAAVGLSMWAAIIEFDESSALKRADIRSWSAGENILYTLPVGKTAAFGIPGLTNVNQPAPNLMGITYVNNSGANRTLGAISIVPAGGAAGVTNQLAGSNVVATANIFSKYFFGGLGPLDSVSLNVDAGTATQFAWVNVFEYNI